jgi:hypothetical protein
MESLLLLLLVGGATVAIATGLLRWCCSWLGLGSVDAGQVGDGLHGL